MDKFFKSSITFPLIIILATCQSFSQNQINLQITSGYNLYFPLNNSYLTYQKFLISELATDQNSLLYHFCYFDQDQKPRFKSKFKTKIFNHSQNNQQLLINNIQEILQMKKLFTSYFSHKLSLLYILSPQSILIYQFSRNQDLKLIKSISLLQKIHSSYFIQESQQILYIITQKRVFSLQNDNQDFNLIERIQLNQISQSFQSIKKIGQYLYIFTQNYVSKYSFQNYQKLHEKYILGNMNIKKQNSIFFNQDKKYLVLIDKQKGIFIGYDVDLNTKQKLSLSSFFQLPQSKNCQQLLIWQQYIILKCVNHIIYLSQNQLIKCKSSSEEQQKIMNCLDQIIMGRIYTGYHIQSISLFGDVLILTGASNFQLLQIVKKTDENSRKSTILQIKRAKSYHLNQKINKVFLPDFQSAIILTNNQLLVGQNLLQKNYLYCKTIDQNNRVVLSHPKGYYKGNITIQGICSLNINQKTAISQKKVEDTNICRIDIQLNIFIKQAFKREKWAWYILLSIILLITVVNVVFCIFKKRKFNQKYKIFEDQKEIGQKVLQATITQINREEGNKQ